MKENQCEVKLVPHKIDGLHIRVKGCKDELAEIDSYLQKVGRRYWHKRIEYVDMDPSVSE